MVWIAIKDRLPKEGELVKTRIEDDKGIRNEQILFRRGKTWFLPDEAVHVYYEPTHWHPLHQRLYKNSM